jgi:hypothetical protein
MKKHAPWMIEQTANPSLLSFELYANMRMDAHIKMLLKAHREHKGEKN